ncbi:MAG: hypothetical protein IJX72_06510 [Clostridia bacterium]|nr:hypothetical protein [Clostridia bacterium]
MAQNTNQPSALDSVKKSIGKAADLTSLKIKLGQAKAKRKNAYTHLGELSYTKYRPRTDEVTEDIETAIQNTVNEITACSQEILELELRIKLLKADM